MPRSNDPTNPQLGLGIWGTSGRQLLDAASIESRKRILHLDSGNHQFGRELGERHQHEGALEHARVRQRQFTPVEPYVVVGEQIEVQRTRPPMPLMGAVAAELFLDPMQRGKQPMRIEPGVDLELYSDLSESSRSDHLADTVSYANVVTTAVAAFKNTNYKLLERAAGAVADAILAAYPRIRSVEVTVHKPHAPIAAIFNDVGVTVLRKRRG